MEGGGGSEIESYDRVSKKPKLRSHHALRDDLGYMSEDESDNDYSDELDSSTHVPLVYHFSEISIMEQSQPDPELREIRERIAELRSMGFKGISFTARCISDAYICLHIFSDPVDSNPMEHLISSKQRGFKINYVDREGYFGLKDCFDLTGDIEYLQLLKILRDSRVDVKKIPFEGIMPYYKLMHDSSPAVCYYEDCFWDYRHIYAPMERVILWRDLRNHLLDPNSAEEYRKDPKSFEETLKRNYHYIKSYGVATVFEDVVKWWKSGLEKDGKSAKMLLENGCEKALQVHDDRLKGGWTKADYLKLKLDVVRIVGISKIPDEIGADFVLPGHYSWNESKGTFDSLPYK